jgi:hypothetical protein
MEVQDEMYLGEMDGVDHHAETQGTSSIGESTERCTFSLLRRNARNTLRIYFTKIKIRSMVLT